MNVSVNWAQYYSDANLSPDGIDSLVKRVGAQLGSIEDVTRFGKRYEGAVVARVVSCEKHPDADKLHICRIDDAGVTKEAERGDDGLVQVVCGAPNVHADMCVIWLPPGATVPATFSDNEPFVLGARELRGVKSNGMLASASELGISDDHSGILEISSDQVGEELAKPGTPLKALFGLDDTVIDCENKMFTHRPDCFGILGVARELAGIQNIAFKSPDWYLNTPVFESAEDLPLKVEVQTDSVPRFMAVAIKGVAIAPSPTYMQAGLSRVGIRPINNIVDITNWMMHLTGQPLHAYDYDKVKALSGNTPTLLARSVAAGAPEQLTLLNGKVIDIKDTSDIVIATDNQVIGLGGVMGGADTEVDESTQNIIIECASFDMYSIRRTSMRHGLFTDAATRFTKGQSVHQNDRVLLETLRLVREITGGEQASVVCDVKPTELPLPSQLAVSAQFVNERLGSQISANEMSQLLINVECEVELRGEELLITPPFWRTDIEIPEDIVEEVGRLYGFDTLPVNLPSRTSNPTKINELLAVKSRVRQALAAAGANEVLGYSFVHGKLLEKVGQNPEHSYQLANALSPELQYYRQTLTPSLLDKVYANIRAGYEEFSLFEIGKSHTKAHELNDEGLPSELEMFAFVYIASNKAAQRREGAAFYQARAYLDALAKQLGLQLTYSAINDTPEYPVTRPFAINRSAYVSTSDGVFLGIIGEYRQEVITNFKLPVHSAGFELGTEDLLKALSATSSTYKPLSKYPRVTQDISLKLEKPVPFGEVWAVLNAQLQALTKDEINAKLSPIDIYNQDDVSHVTFRVSAVSPLRTLTANEVNALLDELAAQAGSKFGATRI